MKADFLNIVAQHQNILHKVCHLYTDTTEDREDLFQEIIIQLWKSFHQFEGKSKISTWMYKVALHTAFTHLRKVKKQHVNQEQLKESINFQNLPERYDNDDYKKLHKAICHLNNVERAIILLYLEKHSYHEIANLTGMSVTNIGVKINRIKSKLKNLMQLDHG